ncbi:MAG: hypothetical protein HYZ74_07860 [Elusimicrobia bacterium]|nr:hypothetical protein [Elusimicrobiota bacterium]
MARPLLVVAALALLGPFGFGAEPSARKSGAISTKSFGEGGGYKHPDAAVGGFFEQAPPRPADLKPERPRLPGQSTPPSAAKAAESSSPRLASPSASPDSAKAPAGSLRLDGARADADEAAASENARRDYETRLLGQAAQTGHPGLAAPGAGAIAPAGAAEEGSLFVSLELDPQESGSLRDAVAGLSQAAAFRADSRFQPMPGQGGSIQISGWLPVSRLGDAIARPGVRRVMVEHAARSARASGTSGDFVVGLRVADPAHPEESILAGVKNLQAQADFKIAAADGRPRFYLEAVPGGALAMVAGRLPVSRLSRALAIPGVVKITPALAAAEEAPPARGPGRMARFLNFVLSRGLWLAVLTLLLALPTIGKAIMRALSVFVPYR